MDANKKNKIIGALQAQVDSEGDVKLFSLRNNELTTGTYLDIAFKLAGYTESPRAVINKNNWWDIKVSGLVERLTS